MGMRKPFGNPKLLGRLGITALLAAALSAGCTGTLGFGSEGGEAWVFRVRPERVLSFAKDPHGQTTYRFAAPTGTRVTSGATSPAP